MNWLRQPATFSDREWILAIAEQFRDLQTGVQSPAMQKRCRHACA